MFSVGLPAAPFLYPILDSKFSDDPLGDGRKLVKAGVKILQYRAKDRSQRQIYEETRGLAEVCAENRVCLIVNDHVGVALVTGASGVHLGQDDFPVLEARRLLGTKLIGISTHNHMQFTVAERWTIDYIAIGPVYSTTTKLNS